MGLTMEGLGTRQMKWIDTLRWRYADGTDINVKDIFWSWHDEECYASKQELSVEGMYPYDHRQTIKRELVFDIDLKEPYTTTQELGTLANDIVAYSRTLNQEPILCHSGGEGFHIHMFTKSYRHSEELGKKIITKLCLKSLCGYGKPIDVNLLHNNHHIRMIGGKKLLTKTDIIFKSVIRNALDYEIVTEPCQVRFPNVSWYRGNFYEQRDEVW